MPRYRSITEPDGLDVPETQSADDSAPEEIPDASTLALPELEALLAQQERCSKNALENALAKKQETEHLNEQADDCEDEAQALRVRYEEAELTIQELRKLVVERYKQNLERHSDTNQARASTKRSYTQDQSSNVARKRAAVASSDEANDPVIKRESSSADPRHSVFTLGNRKDIQSSSEDAGIGGALARVSLDPAEGDGTVLPAHGTTPRDVFAHTTENHPLQHANHRTGLARMVRHDNPTSILIYTGSHFAGAKRNKRAAYAGIFGIATPHSGPVTWAYTLAVTRPNISRVSVALHAVVAALERKAWGKEGWEQVTIATESAYVYDGFTKRLARWQAKGKLGDNNRKNLKDKDLWVRVYKAVEEQVRHGCKVEFWNITAEQNQHAARIARQQAEN